MPLGSLIIGLINEHMEKQRQDQMDQDKRLASSIGDMTPEQIGALDPKVMQRLYGKSAPVMQQLFMRQSQAKQQFGSMLGQGLGSGRLNPLDPGSVAKFWGPQIAKNPNLYGEFEQELQQAEKYQGPIQRAEVSAQSGMARQALANQGRLAATQATQAGATAREQGRERTAEDIASKRDATSMAVAQTRSRASATRGRVQAGKMLDSTLAKATKGWTDTFKKIMNNVGGDKAAEVPAMMDAARQGVINDLATAASYLPDPGNPKAIKKLFDRVSGQIPFMGPSIPPSPGEKLAHGIGNVGRGAASALGFGEGGTPLEPRPGPILGFDAAMKSMKTPEERNALRQQSIDMLNEVMQKAMEQAQMRGGAGDGGADTNADTD